MLSTLVPFRFKHLSNFSSYFLINYFCLSKFERLSRRRMVGGCLERGTRQNQKEKKTKDQTEEEKV